MTMRFLAAFALLFLIPTGASAFAAGCWILTDLSGQAMYASDKFKPVKDGFTHTNPRIVLVLNGTRTTATGDESALVQVSDHMAIGAVESPEGSFIETYSVDPDTKRVFYTKSVFTRVPLLAPLTSTHMLVGHASACR